MITIKGHFEGSTFIPDEPVDLPQNRPVIVQVDPAPTSPPKKTGKGLMEAIRDLAGTVEGMPADWAAEHDHYLYGTPKRGDSNSK